MMLLRKTIMTPESIALLLTSVTAMLVAIGACCRKSRCSHITLGCLGLTIDRDVVRKSCETSDNEIISPV